MEGRTAGFHAVAVRLLQPKMAFHAHQEEGVFVAIDVIVHLLQRVTLLLLGECHAGIIVHTAEASVPPIPDTFSAIY